MNILRVPVLGTLLFFSQALFAASSVIEDFSSIPTNPALHGVVDSQIDTATGQYKMVITQDGTDKTDQRINIDQQDETYISVKATLSSESDTSGSPAPSIRARLSIAFFEDPAVDADEDDPLVHIWTQLAIERRSDGRFRVFAFAEKTDAESSEEELFFQRLSPTITYDQPVELAIERNGPTVNYKVNGTTEFVFNLTDNTTYPALTGKTYPNTSPTRFTGRIQSGPGTAVILLDDITSNSIEEVPAATQAHSIPTSSQWGLLLFITLLLIGFGFRKQN